MRSVASHSGHGTVASKMTLRHSSEVVGAATHFSVTIVNGLLGKPGVDTDITVVMSEFVTEDELKQGMHALLAKLQMGNVKFVKTPEDLKKITVSEDAKIKRERKDEPGTSVGPNAS